MPTPRRGCGDIGQNIVDPEIELQREMNQVELDDLLYVSDIESDEGVEVLSDTEVEDLLRDPPPSPRNLDNLPIMEDPPEDLVELGDLFPDLAIPDHDLLSPEINGENLFDKVEDNLNTPPPSPPPAYNEIENNLNVVPNEQNEFNNPEVEGDRHAEMIHRISTKMETANLLLPAPWETGHLYLPAHVRVTNDENEISNCFPLPPWIKGEDFSPSSLDMMIEFLSNIINFKDIKSRTDIWQVVGFIINRELIAQQTNWRYSSIFVKDMLLFFLSISPYEDLTDRDKSMLAEIYLIFVSDEYRTQIRLGFSFNHLIQSITFIQRLRGGGLGWSMLPKIIKDL